MLSTVKCYKLPYRWGQYILDEQKIFYGDVIKYHYSLIFRMLSSCVVQTISNTSLQKILQIRWDCRNCTLLKKQMPSNPYTVNSVNTPWAYIRTKDKFDGPLFGGLTYGGRLIFERKNISICNLLNLLSFFPV